MKCVEEAVTGAVVGQRTGEHRAAGDPVVVGTAAVGDDLGGGVLIAQSYDGVVLRVWAEVQCRAASFHVAAGEGVSITLLQIDAVRARDRVPIVCRAIDVKA